MAFKAINDSAGPDGLVLTLLVFEAYLKMIESDTLFLTVAQKATAIKKTMAKIHKLQAERQVANALNTHNKPMTNAVYSLLPSSPVLVWREDNTRQAGR
jgi:hypothetical protein